MNSVQQNITRIKVVYDALEELANEVVFVGGATMALYSTRPVGDVRPTDDVDVLLELFHYKDYAIIEEKLRSKGFVNSTESGIICRYSIKGIVVDIMPTEWTVLGFANRWYPQAFQSAIEHTVDGYTIRILRSDYFVATKIRSI